MKKLILSLIAVMTTLSISAQIVEVYENGTLTATYTNSSTNTVKVIFKEIPAEEPVSNASILPGKFSVSDSKQVQFTSGNLYYSTTDNAYHIESAQNVTYKTLGQTKYDATHVCHFYWSNITDWQTSNKEPWASTYDYSIQSVTDKFFCGKDNKMSADGLDDLYALTSDEYTYLFTKRTNASNLYKLEVSVTTSAGTVENCVVIAPDDYTGTIAESYDADAWTAAESEGLVCLPAAGYNGGYSFYDEGKVGRYWSATPCNNLEGTASCLYFLPDYVYPAFDLGRQYGFSVRLVQSYGATTGKAAVLESAGITDNKVQWVQLWKDGPKWAAFNVGAKSDSEYGGLYNWGVSEEMGSSNYYIFSSSSSDIQGTSDDTAKNLWGSNWQMPNVQNLRDLLSKCDAIWTTQNGMLGRLYTGKDDYSSNSIFLPAAGYGFYDLYYDVYEKDHYGDYWSSTPDSGNSTYIINFVNDDQDVYCEGRAYGRCVRAILKE